MPAVLTSCQDQAQQRTPGMGIPVFAPAKKPHGRVWSAHFIAKPIAQLLTDQNRVSRKASTQLTKLAAAQTRMHRPPGLPFPLFGVDVLNHTREHGYAGLI